MKLFKQIALEFINEKKDSETDTPIVAVLSEPIRDVVGETDSESLETIYSDYVAMEKCFDALDEISKVQNVTADDNSQAVTTLAAISTEAICQRLGISRNEISTESANTSNNPTLFKRVLDAVKKFLNNIWQWIVRYYQEQTKKTSRLESIINHDKQTLSTYKSTHGDEPTHAVCDLVSELLSEKSKSKESKLNKFQSFNTTLNIDDFRKMIKRNKEHLVTLSNYCIDLLHTVKLFTGQLPNIASEKDLINKMVFTRSDFLVSVQHGPLDSKIGSLRGNWFNIHEVDGYLSTKITGVNGSKGFQPSSIKVLSDYSKGNRIIFVKREFHNEWVYMTYVGKQSIDKKDQSSYGPSFSNTDVFKEIDNVHIELTNLLHDVDKFNDKITSTLSALSNEKEIIVKFIDGISAEVKAIGADVLNKLLIEIRFIINYLEIHAVACGKFSNITLGTIEDITDVMHEVASVYKQVNRPPEGR